MSEIILMALGAALMYFFDPVSGRQRRAWLRDQWDRVAKKRTAAEQSVAETTPADRAAAVPTDEALGSRRQGGGIADEPGDPASRYKHE